MILKQKKSAERLLRKMQYNEEVNVPTCGRSTMQSSTKKGHHNQCTCDFIKWSQKKLHCWGLKQWESYKTQKYRKNGESRYTIQGIGINNINLISGKKFVFAPGCKQSTQ